MFALYSPRFFFFLFNSNVRFSRGWNTLFSGPRFLGGTARVLSIDTRRPEGVPNSRQIVINITADSRVCLYAAPRGDFDVRRSIIPRNSMAGPDQPLVDVLWTVSRLLTSNCLDIMPCFHVISPIFPGVPYRRREVGFRPARSCGDPLHLRRRIILAASETKGRGAGGGRGKEIERRKRYPCQPAAVPCVKFNVAVDGDGFLPVETDRIAAGSRATFVDLSSRPKPFGAGIVIGAPRKIVRDNVPDQRETHHLLRSLYPFASNHQWQRPTSGIGSHGEVTLRFLHVRKSIRGSSRNENVN